MNTDWSKWEVIQEAFQIEGWGVASHFSKLWDLGRQARKVGPCFLEVGTWKGRSAYVLAALAERLMCVDTWKGVPERPDYSVYREAQTEDVLAQAKTNLARYGERVTFVQGDSRKVLPELPEGLFSLVYIDGDHAGATVTHDIVQGSRVLKPGGILCGDDHDENGIQNALAFLELPVQVHEKKLWWWTAPVEAAKNS